MKALNQSITLAWEKDTPLTIEIVETRLCELINSDEKLIQWVITGKEKNNLFLDLMLTKA